MIERQQLSSIKLEKPLDSRANYKTFRRLNNAQKIALKSPYLK